MTGAPRPLPIDPAALRAIVFDVDGTLYRQGGVRRGMLVRLLRAHARRPAQGMRTMRALQAYRRAQEHMRRSSDGSGGDGDTAAGQLRLACIWSGLDPGELGRYVERWMHTEPLDLVARAARPGLADFLEKARRRGLRLGVLSDYPPAAKLAALGVDRYFDVAVCAQDADVRAFKPSPRGIRVALARMGVEPGEALYVGDRPEVDAAAAAAAGVPCAIVGRRDAARAGGWTEVSGYAALGRAIFHDQ